MSSRFRINSFVKSVSSLCVELETIVKPWRQGMSERHTAGAVCEHRKLIFDGSHGECERVQRDKRCRAVFRGRAGRHQGARKLTLSPGAAFVWPWNRCRNLVSVEGSAESVWLLPTIVWWPDASIGCGHSGVGPGRTSTDHATPCHGRVLGF